MIPALPSLGDLTMTPDLSFAANLRAARARINMNQSQLARLCGYGQTNISKWDRGFSTPTVDQLLVLAAALGTTPEDLVRGLALPAKPKPAASRAKAAPKTGTRARTNPRPPSTEAPPLVTRRPRRQPPVEAA